MPIRESEKARYPANWREISLEVRERAGQRCEACKAPNGETVLRHVDGSVYILPERGEVFDASNGEPMGYCRGSEFPAGRFVKIVLTVAHLDHQPENNGEPGNRPNLKAWCQKCHLAYDAPLHQANARATRQSRKASGDLFSEVEK